VRGATERDDWDQAMRNHGHKLLAIAMLAALSGPRALAQGPMPTPAPAPSADGSTTIGELRPWYPAPPLVPFPKGTDPVPSLDHDPILEDPAAPRGLIGSVELGILVPHLKNKIFDTVTQNNGSQLFIEPVSADLDWTVAPRIELGYRMGEGLGEFTVDYRFFATQGVANLPEVGGTTAAKSRLDLDCLNLGYTSREIALGPHWDMMWSVGVRFASTFYDNQNNTFGAGALTTVEHASAYWIGAGPWVGLDLARTLPIDGLSIYGRLRGANLWGHEAQHFTDITGTLFGTAKANDSPGVAVVEVQGGLRWSAPPGCHLNYLFFGYMFELWTQVARDDSTGVNFFGSIGDFYDNGLVFRAEFTF
jgi:hypothetical protein